MARPRQPIALVEAKGRKHLGKAEIEARRAAEVQPCVDGIEPPDYLTTKQKATFTKLAEQLQKIKILGETDVDTLARYVSVQSLYEAATKKLRAAMKSMDDLEQLEKLAKLQDRYFRQAQQAASSLGLTITSRCSLQVPVSEEQPKENKFARFGAD